MDLNVITRYHQDLIGATFARIPIDFGNVPSTATTSNAALGGRANLKKITRLRELNGEPADLPISYSAGLRLYQQSVSADVVLNGLSCQALSRRQISSIASRSVVYVLLVGVVAVIGLAVHNSFVTPTFDAFRADLQLDSVVQEPTGTHLFQTLATSISIVALIVLTIVLLIGPARWVHWFGGKKYKMDQAALAATRAAKESIVRGTEKHEAIRVASDLVGGIPAVKRQLTDAVEFSDDAAELGERLNSLAAYLHATAIDRLAVMHALVPTVIVTGIGGLIALTCGLAVFLPLIDVLKQLAQLV